MPMIAGRLVIHIIKSFKLIFVKLVHPYNFWKKINFYKTKTIFTAFSCANECKFTCFVELFWRPHFSFQPRITQAELFLIYFVFWLLN